MVASLRVVDLGARQSARGSFHHRKMVASLRVVVADRRPHMRVFPPSKDGGFIEGVVGLLVPDRPESGFHHRKMVASLRDEVSSPVSRIGDVVSTIERWWLH